MNPYASPKSFDDVSTDGPKPSSTMRRFGVACVAVALTAPVSVAMCLTFDMLGWIRGVLGTAFYWGIAFMLGSIACSCVAVLASKSKPSAIQLWAAYQLGCLLLFRGHIRSVNHPIADSIYFSAPFVVPIFAALAAPICRQIEASPMVRRRVN